MLKWLGRIVVVIALLAGAGWWAIGPTWRTFLADPPAGPDVLFWTQSQRDSGFALVDRIPFVTTVPIAAGDTPRALPQGPELPNIPQIEAFMQTQNTAGLVILQRGEIRFEAYGLNQNPDRRWTSFSVAKSLTSTLVGIAINQGHIASLNDPVSLYINGLQGSAYDDVSIEQLLTMTSGVAWDEDYSDPNSDVARFNEVELRDGEPSIVSYLRDLPRAHPPGEVFNYSTGETNLVGILVEAATGHPLNDYLSENIWKPAGMAQSGSWVLSGSGEPISGCCIQATTRDMARFGQFILEGGLINGVATMPDGYLGAATSTRMETDRNAGMNYGYQWWLRPDGSFAAIGIFGQYIFVDPARELVIAGNSSWQDARGHVADQRAGRNAFFDAIQAVLDTE